LVSAASTFTTGEGLVNRSSGADNERTWLLVTPEQVVPDLAGVVFFAGAAAIGCWGSGL
jgi:hypothetical protein